MSDTLKSYCTGIKDENGIEIRYGDVIRNGYGEKYAVRYFHDRFVLIDMNQINDELIVVPSGFESYPFDKWTIIGTVYSERSLI